MSDKVLVLNKNWQPIKILNAFDAISDLFIGKAECIDCNYNCHDFDSWVNNWEDLYDISSLDKTKIIVTSQFKFMIPEIIKYKTISRAYDFKVKFSRKNVFKRDGNVCQYCHKEFPLSRLNIDHILPRCRGGKTTWENVVVSCIKCNSKKDDKTPEEANMKLLKQPMRPLYIDHDNKKYSSVPKFPTSWNDFVGHMYWNAELKE